MPGKHPRRAALRALSRPPQRSTTLSPRQALSPLDEHRLRRRLRRSACGENWVDAQIVSIDDTTADGVTISCRYHDPTIHPPGGCRATRMRWCRECGRYTPPNCIHLVEHRHSLVGPVISATLRCDDCRIALEAQVHRELHDAFPQLRPSGSLSFVRLRELFAERRRMS